MAVNGTYQNTESPSGGQTAVACSACGHPWAEHDQIAARYCTATTAGRYERGCVCTATPSTET